VTDFVAQLKHVLRRLVRSPLFTVVTLLTVAIAVGANSAVFSVVNGILLKPLPYPDPEGLVRVWQTAPGIGILGPAYLRTGFRRPDGVCRHRELYPRAQSFDCKSC